jgi:hypothetical protein
VQRLVRRLANYFHFGPDQVLRHGDLKATACPGKLFPTDFIAAAGMRSASGSELTNSFHP